MLVQLQDLEEDLQKNGWTEKGPRGGNNSRPEGKSYSVISNNYFKIMRQLYSFLPQEDKQEEIDDGFDAFVASRDEDWVRPSKTGE